jgi:tetratricopeptide (TPR) repeat protein
MNKFFLPRDVSSTPPRCFNSGTTLFLGALLISAALVAAVSPLYAAPAPSASGLDRGPSGIGNEKSFELNEQGVKAQLEGRNSQAEEFFRRAVATDPRNLTAAFNLASVLVLNKKLPEAISLLEGYVKEFDQDPGLFSRLGDAYFTDKKLEPALENYRKAFALDAKYPRLAHRLATIHGLMNNPKEVERFLRLAVEQDPRDFQALASFGSMLLFNGKVDQAIAVTKQSLQVKPTSEAYITLGTAYEARGDLSNSLISFQRARDLGDSRKELKERIKGLEARLAKKDDRSTPRA